MQSNTTKGKLVKVTRFQNLMTALHFYVSSSDETIIYAR